MFLIIKLIIILLYFIHGFGGWFRQWQVKGVVVNSKSQYSANIDCLGETQIYLSGFE